MDKNVGKTDKIIRIIIGLIILAAGIYYKSWWGVLSVIPFFVAFTSWCPMYVPCHINTNRSDN